MNTSAARHIAPWLLLVALLAQCLFAAWDTGQTVDETFYTGASYPMVRYNDYTISGEHPPLIMQLATVPLLFSKPNFTLDDLVYLGDSDGVNLGQVGSRILYKLGNDPQRHLFLQRIPIVLLTLMLGVVLCLWSKSLFGWGGAVVSMTLFAFSPNILAHGSIFTSDLGVTAFFFLAAYRLKKLFDDFNLRNAVWAGLCCGLAFLSKMSALILLPVAALLFGFFLFFERDVRATLGTRENIAIRILAVALFLMALGQKSMLVALGPICLLMVHLVGTVDRGLGKGITYAVTALGWGICLIFATQLRVIPVLRLGAIGWVLANLCTGVFFARRLQSTRMGGLLKVFAVVWFIAVMVMALGYLDFYQSLPQGKPFYHYIRSLIISISHSRSHHAVYVSGSFIATDWRYFLGTMAVKTPIATLLLFLAGIFFVAKSSMSRINKAVLFVTPAVFWFVASFVNTINIGLRHILPIYPFLFLIAGAVAPGILALKAPAVRRVVTAGLTVMLALFVVRTAQIGPHYLSYFNEFVGGPENGVKLLGDSNLSWGQDNRRLVQWVREQNLSYIKIATTFDNIDEYNYYRLPWSSLKKSDFEHPEAGFYALDLPSYHTEQSKENSWFKNRQPVATVGKTILIFEAS